MRASTWLNLELPKRHCLAANDLNRAALERGADARWSGVQRGEHFRAVGIDLPDLRAMINQRTHGFDRVHFAAGLDVRNSDFVLGEECAQPVYLGVRIHRGAQTVSRALHDEIYHAAIDRLQRATDPALLWQPRGQFWSIWAYVPTTVNGVLLSDEEYRSFVVDQALKGHAAIANLWAGAGHHAAVGGLSHATNATLSRRFEYQTIHNATDEVLNTHGAEGWEAVGITHTTDGPGVLLKRQL